MAEDHVTLQEAIELASQLDSDDRLRLRHALDRMTEGATAEEPKMFKDEWREIIERIRAAPTEEEPEMNFKRVLLEKGMISEIRSPRKVGGTAKRRPVPVKGKPVSETIIEDRG
jgi:hypothetical protein